MLRRSLEWTFLGMEGPWLSRIWKTKWLWASSAPSWHEKASSILGCVKRSMACRWEEMIFPLCSRPVRPNLEYCDQFWAPESKNNMDSLEQVQRRTTKMVKGLDHLSYVRSWESWDYAAWRRIKRELIIVYKYLLALIQEVEARVFSLVPTERTWVNRNELKILKFHLKTRKHFFYCGGWSSTGTACSEMLWSLHPW